MKIVSVGGTNQNGCTCFTHGITENKCPVEQKQDQSEKIEEN